MLKHDVDLKLRAAKLVNSGMGYTALAGILGIPMYTARNWVRVIRAVGSERFMDMGSTHAKYDWETKVAAARDFVDHGMTKREVMAKHGITSVFADGLHTLRKFKWCKGVSSDSACA